jgi:hypothetical protein
MKGKIFIFILLSTAVYALLRCNGYFDAPMVQVQGTFVSTKCEEKIIDLMVVAVRDSSVKRLMNKKISAELPFHQSKLDAYFRDHVAKGDTSGFLMMGYPVEGRKLHCSGSTCFTVRRIKTLQEQAFTDL